MKPELKDLAECSAEFLGLKKHLNVKNAWKFQVLQENLTLYLFDFFDDSMPVAPILMHLGKREMEKRFGDVWECSSWNTTKGRIYEYEISNDGKEYKGRDLNEFIAFWSAVHEAMKGGE